MYMPGRRRTASRPSSTVMSLAPYPSAALRRCAPALGDLGAVRFLALFALPPVRALLATQSFPLAGVMRNPDRRYAAERATRAVRGIDSSSYKDTKASPRKTPRMVINYLQM